MGKRPLECSTQTATPAGQSRSAVSSSCHHALTPSTGSRSRTHGRLIGTAGQERGPDRPEATRGEQERHHLPP